MNRSILIVICDFLLVSLLAFSTVDVNKVSDENSAGKLKTEMVTNQVDAGKDLAAVMRLALDEERKTRDQLVGELNKTRGVLTEREQQVAKAQQTLQTQEQQAQRLQQEQTILQQRYLEAQTNLLSLNEQLRNTSVDALLSKEKLAAMEAEARKQATALQEQLAAVQQSNQVVLGQKQELAGRLQVVESEKRSATEQVARMVEEVKTERAEKAKLAEGVKALASRSSELAREVRENRPLAPNTIYSEFLTNRVEARFTASRATLLGGTKRRDSETVLVSDGTNVFALCHVQDTPMTFFNPGTDWEALTGTLSRETRAVPVQAMAFHLQDPRVVLVPVTQADVRSLGVKVYRISPDPFKFQDAILIGTRDPYYGECRFQIDSSTPEYLKLDNSFLKGLFGKFNPSRGDLVLSRTGELLGIMANSTYCFMIHNFDAAAKLQFGQDVRPQRTGVTLSLLYSQVAQMPPKLQ